MIGVFAIIRTFGLHVDQGNGRMLSSESRALQHSILAHAHADRA